MIESTAPLLSGGHSSQAKAFSHRSHGIRSIFPICISTKIIGELLGYHSPANNNLDLVVIPKMLHDGPHFIPGGAEQSTETNDFSPSFNGCFEIIDSTIHTEVIDLKPGPF